jgi:hypothetical protein
MLTMDGEDGGPDIRARAISAGMKAWDSLPEPEPEGFYLTMGQVVAAVVDAVSPIIRTDEQNALATAAINSRPRIAERIRADVAEEIARAIEDADENYEFLGSASAGRDAAAIARRIGATG